MANGFDYIEPVDYFPEEIRKECKLGEYWEIEYEEAKAIAFEIAEERGRVIDKAIEYSDAFVFCDTKSTLIGDVFPLVILKKDASFVHYPEYISSAGFDGIEINVWEY